MVVCQLVLILVRQRWFLIRFPNRVTTTLRLSSSEVTQFSPLCSSGPDWADGDAAVAILLLLGLTAEVVIFAICGAQSCIKGVAVMLFLRGHTGLRRLALGTTITRPTDSRVVGAVVAVVAGGSSWVALVGPQRVFNDGG